MIITSTVQVDIGDNGTNSALINCYELNSAFKGLSFLVFTSLTLDSYLSYIAQII